MLGFVECTKYGRWKQTDSENGADWLVPLVMLFYKFEIENLKMK